MSLSIQADGSTTISTDDSPVTGVRKLKVSTMHSLKAGGTVQTGTMDQYGNGTNKGKNTTFSDQSATAVTGIKNL